MKFRKYWPTVVISFPIAIFWFCSEPRYFVYDPRLKSDIRAPTITVILPKSDRYWFAKRLPEPKWDQRDVEWESHAFIRNIPHSFSFGERECVQAIQSDSIVWNNEKCVPHVGSLENFEEFRELSSNEIQIIGGVDVRNISTPMRSYQCLIVYLDPSTGQKALGSLGFPAKTLIRFEETQEIVPYFGGANSYIRATYCPRSLINPGQWRPKDY